MPGLRHNLDDGPNTSAQRYACRPRASAAAQSLCLSHPLRNLAPLVLLLAAAHAFAALPSSICLNLGNQTAADTLPYGTPPYFFADFDAAGYSDIIYYGRSPRHPYTYHELLSGEWAGAVHYDGIATQPKAMWLTDKFVMPFWTTNSQFIIDPQETSSPHEWNNPANPTPLTDSAHSALTDGRLRVTIDFEVVDLAASQDPNRWAGSPISLPDMPNKGSQYIPSDRFILLQTYTFTNVAEPNLASIENLEFYQMLHSHGADDWGSAVSSHYSKVLYRDPLENYIPYNPVHQVGNFRYDITQWNNPDHPESLTRSWPPHTDYVTFSSTREPDFLDASTYNDHVGKPSAGTHIHVENRQLNGDADIEYAQAAAAMGWSLGNLDPNESVSLTLAFMFSHGEPSSRNLPLHITTTPDPVIADDRVPVVISLDNPITDPLDPNYLGTLEDLTVTCTFPPDLYGYSYWYWPSPDSVEVQDGAITWHGIDLPPGQTWTANLTFYVLASAEPCSQLDIIASALFGDGYVRDSASLKLGCWGGDIVYVKPSADPAGGTSWRYAYNSLHKALQRAAKGCGREIWIAQGSYSASLEQADPYSPSPGLEIYGGFQGHESFRLQRNPLENPTWLTTDPDQPYVMQIQSLGQDEPNSLLLDGLFFTGANTAALNVANCGPSLRIRNCSFQQSLGAGLRLFRADPDIAGSLFHDNAGPGAILLEGSHTPSFDRCRFSLNASHGLYADGACPLLTNSFLFKNQGHGVFLQDPNVPALIRNCTITANSGYGVKRVAGQTPILANSILWANNPTLTDFGPQIAGCPPIYSCIYDPNCADPPAAPDDFNNIYTDPGLAWGDPNLASDFHLAPDSPCIDRGQPLEPPEQSDLDGDPRFDGPAPDIGADERICADGCPDWDWNTDGIIAQYEFATLVAAWDSIEPGHSANPDDSLRWDPRCDLDADHHISLTDLLLLQSQWLNDVCFSPVPSPAVFPPAPAP